ncbi:MAG: glutamate--cysteine ligase [Polyangiales bacterium]
MLESRAAMTSAPRTTVDPHPHAFPKEPPLRDEGELELPFVQSCKPREQWRVGAEAEKFGVHVGTGTPLHYRAQSNDRSGGVEHVLQVLVERHGWTEESEYPGAPTIALRRGEASVTLEPGAQLELSGAPLANMHAIAGELVSHLSEIEKVSKTLGVVWLGVGFHPFARQEDLDWVPKSRYAVMREYLPTRGKYGLDMMRRTATVQANYDYSSEQDALRKLRVSLKLAPVTTAIFANSPFVEGKITGELSRRAKVWLDVDPDRTGLLPQTWKEGAGFRPYIEWALDCPMFMFKRDGHAVDNRGQRFRDFLRDGYRGHRATMSDWETHLNTLFPEVRLKRTIEIRGADSLPTAYFAALPALWTGLFYDDAALAEVDALCADLTDAELVAVRQRVPFEALRAPFRGKPLAALAEKVVDIAARGLQRRAILGRDGRDERAHLQAIQELVAQAKCPADVLLEATKGLEGEALKQAILVHAAM